MKYEEALEYAKGGLEVYLRAYPELTTQIEFQKLSIEALEKQIPKKAEANHHCPSCGCGLPHEGITSEICKCCFDPLYCSYCGQAIDWSDEE